MNPLTQSIIQQLQQELDTAIAASNQAHASATDSENIPDNKYDTLALEAAYLAHGHSQRIQDLQNSVQQYRHFTQQPFNKSSSIDIGALITLEDEQLNQQQLFIGPVAGGLMIKEDQDTITVITPQTPLGQALIGKYLDDEVTINTVKTTQHFTITNIQ